MRFLLTLLALFSANVYPDKASFDIQMDHVTLVVSDVDRSANFYLKFLMLTEFETPWGKTPMGRMFFIGSAGELHIAKGEKPTNKPNKRVHTAFRIRKFDEYLLFLEDNGIRFANFEGDPGVFQTRPDGVRQVYFQDPDGYWIEVNSEPENRTGHILTK